MLTFMCFFACQRDEGNSGKSVEEIQSESLEGNAKIIRNPITANQPTDTVNVAKMTFEETTYDFGLVEEGAIVEHTFKFTNTGKAPLVISDARSTCGCTVPKWTQDAVRPGESGEIKVLFKTMGKRDRQEKPVIITANTYPAETKVYLEGVVRAKEGGGGGSDES